MSKIKLQALVLSQDVFPLFPDYFSSFQMIKLPSQFLGFVLIDSMPGGPWFLGAELHFRDTSHTSQGCFSSPAAFTGSWFPGWQALSLPLFQQTSSSGRHFSPYNQITLVPHSRHSPAVLRPLCPTAPEVADLSLTPSPNANSSSHNPKAPNQTLMLIAP